MNWLSETYVVNIRVKIVADDLKGYGKKTKLLGQIGTIIGWKPNRSRSDDGKIPIIKLESGRIVCNKKIWWSRL